MAETRNEKNPHSNAKRIWEVSPFIVFGLCGFVLYLSWVSMAFLSPATAPEHIALAMSAEGDPGPYLLFRFIQVAALLITLVVGWGASDALSSIRGVQGMLFGSLTLISLGFIVIALLDAGASVTDPTALFALPLVAAALMGVGQAFMVLLWSSFLSAIGEHRILLFIALCVGCAACLALLMSFLQRAPTLWITLSLSWMSLGCFAYIRFRLPETPKPLLVKAKASDRRMSIETKSAVSVFIYSIGLGFVLCFIVCSGGGFYGMIAASVAVILSAVITSLDVARFHMIAEDNLARLHMPAIFVGLFPLFFDNLVWQILGCTSLLCFFMIVFIVNLAALSEHVRIYRLNSIRVFGYGRAGNAAGFLIGGFICYLTFYAPYEFLFGPIEQRTWTTILLFGLLIVFIIASSYVFEDHYPKSKGAGKSASQMAKAKAQEPKGALPRSDLHTLSTYMLDEGEGSEEIESGVWTRRVKALSTEYALSPKETEVLFLLAKGRNAEYIQNELVVSRHTAKAHIYHIYQKTGVHSRQELIDMLENVEVDYE